MKKALVLLLIVVLGIAGYVWKGRDMTTTSVIPMIQVPEWQQELHDKYGVVLSIPVEFRVFLTPKEQMAEPTDQQWHAGFGNQDGSILGNLSALKPSSYTQQVCPQDVSYGAVEIAEKLKLPSGEEVMICKTSNFDYTAFIHLHNATTSVFAFEIHGTQANQDSILDLLKQIILSLKVRS
jgi:hypothetical protein